MESRSCRTIIVGIGVLTASAQTKLGSLPISFSKTAGCSLRLRRGLLAWGVCLLCREVQLKSNFFSIVSTVVTAQRAAGIIGDDRIGRMLRRHLRRLLWFPSSVNFDLTAYIVRHAMFSSCIPFKIGLQNSFIHLSETTTRFAIKVTHCTLVLPHFFS